MLINRLTQYVGTYKALVLTQAFSLLFWLAYGPLTKRPDGAGMDAWGMAAVCGIFHVVGLILTYRAFEVGTLSLVSPIASAFAIVTAVVAVIAGERPGAIPLIGTALLIAGVIVVTAASGGGGNATLKGVPEALGSAVGFGIMFWLIQGPEESLGTGWALFVLKAMAFSSSLVAMVARRGKEEVQDAAGGTASKIWLYALAVAVSDSFAWLALLAGYQTRDTTVVTALASLFSVVTVVLAAVLLRERLNRPQWGGILAVFVGIGLVSSVTEPQEEEGRNSSTYPSKPGEPLMSALEQKAEEPQTLRPRLSS